MISQQQDLVFFEDSTLLSNKALSANAGYLHIVSHRAGTKPTWLVNTLVETCLVGTANSVNRDLGKDSARASVVYVSFLHNRDFLVRGCRKLGLDLTRAADFHFVDAFTDLFTQRIGNPQSPKASIEKLFAEVESAVAGIKQGNKVMFIDSPEILLAATEEASNDLLLHISKLAGLCNTTFVILNTDEAIADMSCVTPQDPVYRITDFYVKLFHRSTMNVDVSPLSTGKAKDITGCVTVSKGALDLGNVAVAEKEYVFQVSKEGTVKMYFR